MCLFIESETILANILVNKSEREGIGTYEIKKYCHELNKLLDRKKIPYRYFDISDDSLYKAVIANSKVFLSFGGRYFRRTTIQIDDYNSNYTNDIKKLFIDARNNL